MNINLQKVNPKLNTPKTFRKGTRENLRSSRMAGSTTISETVEKPADSVMSKENLEKTILDNEMAIQILERKTEEFGLRGIVPLPQNLKLEVINDVQLSNDQKNDLANMPKPFPNIELPDSKENIFYFMGEFISEYHLFGKQIKAIKENMDKITPKRFEDQINLVGEDITNTVMHHLDYKNIFKIRKDKLKALLLSFNESPLKHIAKDTAISLTIIGIYHIANFLDKDLIDDLDGYSEIFQTTVDMISTNLKIPHLQIFQFLEKFDLELQIMVPKIKPIYSAQEYKT